MNILKAPIRHSHYGNWWVICPKCGDEKSLRGTSEKVKGTPLKPKVYQCKKCGTFFKHGFPFNYSAKPYSQRQWEADPEAHSLRVSMSRAIDDYMKIRLKKSERD